MRIFITGAQGMLGSSLIPKLRGKHTLFTPSHSELDICNFTKLKHTLTESHPDLIIHLAAMTNVDLCEQYPDLAQAVNVQATKVIGEYATSHEVKLIFISSGAVFSGRKKSAYRETDPCHPVNVYGKTKVEGERLVKRVKGSLILRTGWLIGGGAKDKKFVAMMLHQLANRAKTVSAVHDQYGSPTTTESLSCTLVALINASASGCFHVTNEGIASRFDIAHAVIEFVGKKDVAVKAVPLSSFKLRARRPRMEAMTSSLLKKHHKIELSTWQDALREYILTIS